VEIAKGHAVLDCAYLLLMLSLKCSVAYAAGFLKGKSVIRDFRDYLRVKQSFSRGPVLARSYCANVVGLKEKADSGLHSETGIKINGKSKCDCQVFNSGPIWGRQITYSVVVYDCIKCLSIQINMLLSVLMCCGQHESICGSSSARLS